MTIMRPGRAGIALAAAILAGPAAAQPLDCANAAAQVEMTACAARAYEAADAALNEAYAAARDRARAADAVPAAGPQPAAPLADLLRDAQRAWIPFRDTACGAEAGVYAGGSIANMVFLDCMSRLTRARTDDLAAFAAER